MEEFGGSAIIEVNACQYLYFFIKVILIGSHTNNIFQSAQAVCTKLHHIMRNIVLN
jgi:hypothetical protein